MIQMPSNWNCVKLEKSISLGKLSIGRIPLSVFLEAPCSPHQLKPFKGNDSQFTSYFIISIQHGVMATASGYYFIEPLEDTAPLPSSGWKHVVYKRTQTPQKGHSCTSSAKAGGKRDKHSLLETHLRQNRKDEKLLAIKP